MEFRREYLVRLPLPLAQLYSRAHNAKDARSRHDNAFYLCEALVKLGAATMAACHVEEVQQGQPRMAELDRLLVQLAMPSLGQWLAMFRELARHFGGRPDAASHPLGHLWGQMNAPRRDLPALLALYRRIKNGVDGEPGGDQSCSVLQVLEALVQYRNAVFGHGGPRFESFFEKEMGPLLFPAVNEMLQEGVLDLLGPRGSRLAYITEIRQADQDRFEVGLRELVGVQGERVAPLALTAAQAQTLASNRVCVLWPGRPVPLRLDPLLIYRESDTAEEVLYLNRDHRGRNVEYLSYSTGRTERDKSMAPALATFLSRVCGHDVTPGDLRRLAEQSLTETPSTESLLRPAAPTGQVAGDYELLAELGRGGMGVVYLARQLSLGRLVALKMLPGDLAGDEVALARFRREIRHLALCDHPNIVKVLSDGTLPDGRIYYTMEYVPGCDLENVWRELAAESEQAAGKRTGQTTWGKAVLTASRKRRDQLLTKQGPGVTTTETTGGPAGATTAVAAVLSQLRLPAPADLNDQETDYVRRVVAMVRDAALALQSMHQRGVIHRDVKPANLMLTADGSRVVLMDFGLAKGDSVAMAASKQAGFLGTLRYAAPEQLAAAMVKVGPAADVRALGCVLWELLTRKRLFGDAEDEARLAARVLNDEVPPLRRVDPSLDRDLEAIVTRATEKDAGRRIADAGQLAEYLDLYLNDQPLPIRPHGMRELAWRWVKRHRELATVIGAAAVLLIAAGAATLWYRHDQAQRAAADAEKQTRLENDIATNLDRGGKTVKELREELARPDGVQHLLNEPARWEGLLHVAADAAKHARDLQANADRDVDPKLVEQMTGLEAAVATEEKARQLATNLENLRLERINLVAAEGKSDSKAAAARFEKAFAAAHLAVPDELTKHISSMSIKEQLVAALDDWAMQALKHKDMNKVEQLLTLSRQADPDPLRDKLRDPKVWQDRPELQKTVKDTPPSKLPAHLAYLVGYLLNYHKADAESWLRTAQQLHPADFWLNVESGVVLVETKPADAAGFFRAAIALRPDSGRLYNNLGVALGNLKDYPAAVTAFNTAIALNKDDVTAYYNLGNVLNRKGDYPGAIAAYRSALDHKATFTLLHENLGRALYKNKNLVEAEEELKKWAAEAPKSPDPYVNLGLLNYDQKKYQAAIADYQKALDIDPQCARAYSNWGLALIDQKDFQGAIAKLEKAIQCDPKLGIAYVNLGVAHSQLKDFKAAVKHLQKAIDCDPQNAMFYYRLAVLQAQQEKWPSAISAYNKVVELSPKYELGWLELGLALRAYGDLDGAVAAHQKAATLAPKNVGVLKTLAKSLLDAGQPAEARAPLEKALNLLPPNSPDRAQLEKLLKECEQKSSEP